MVMKLEYVKVAHYKKDTSCPHNDALICERKQCGNCGWHPAVAKRRLEKAIQKRKGAKANG
jgi:hypothetical protein